MPQLVRGITGGFPEHLFIVIGFLLPVFIDGWMLSMYWESLQDDLGGERNSCNSGEGMSIDVVVEAWVIAPTRGCQWEERPLDPKGPEMGLNSGADTHCILPRPLSGPRLFIIRTQTIPKHSDALLRDPLQSVAPVLTGFAYFILIKYILHSGLKYL